MNEDNNTNIDKNREHIYKALPGVIGIQVEGLFIFRDLGRRVIYFQGSGEKAVLESRKHWAEEKHFRELGRNVIFLPESREQRPPPPLGGLIYEKRSKYLSLFYFYISDVTIGKSSSGINFSARDSSGVETGEINLSLDALENKGMSN